MIREESKIEVSEFAVTPEFMNRLDQSALTVGDLEFIAQSRPCRAAQLWDYQSAYEDRKIDLWAQFPLIIPYALVNPRIRDLALDFFSKPDANLITGFKRLENILRDRVKTKLNGTKLIQEAFVNEDAKLFWKGIDPAENAGRGQLFVATFLTFRNPRAHKEHPDERLNLMLEEFMILNKLYQLEESAVEKPRTRKRSQNKKPKNVQPLPSVAKP